MTTYYVATTGSDSAAGGTSTPWLTIQHAVSTAVASDVIKVRSGTYSPFTVTRNGLTIQPDTAAVVIVQAATSYNTAFGTGSSQYAIRLSGLTSCAISGIRVQNAPNQWGAGVLVTGCTGSGSEGSRTISLTDIEADHNHSFGIYITGSSGVDVIRPLCYKNDTGMQISSSSSVYVEDPVLHDNDQLVDPGRGGNGIVFYRSHDVHLLGTDVSGYTGALIYNNRSNSTLYDLSHGGRDGGAFEFYESYNIEIEGIRGWANQNVLETGQGSSTALSSGIEIHNNIFYASDAGYSAPLWSGGCFGMVLRAADGGNVHHNTFYGLGTNTVYITATGSFHGSIAGLTVRDNIIFGGGSGTRCAYIDPSTPGTVVYDYNDQYNPAGTLGHRAGTDQVHGLNADPIFADRTTLDFRLSSTSTCIGAAHDASDLGAIPSGTPPSPPADPGDPPGSGGSPPTAPPPDDPSFSPSWEWRLALHAMDLDEAGHLPAVEVTYDNATSGLAATEVQAAIDELAAGGGTIAAADVTVADTGGFFTATDVEAALQELAKKDLGYTAHGNTGSTETFSALTGWHSATVDMASTFTFSGATSGIVASMILELAEAGFAVTWPGSVVWPGGTAPTLSASGTDLLTFFSRDGGTTWYGFMAGGGSSLTVKDEGTPLATPATSLDFVGAGVVASGTGAGKTITIAGASAAAITALGFVGPILMTDGTSAPPIPMTTEDGTDYLYQDIV